MLPHLSKTAKASSCYGFRHSIGSGVERNQFSTTALALSAFEFGSQKTMKALVKAKPEAGIWMEDVPMPTMDVNDVMIKVDRMAICGTDVHIYKWDEWAQATVPVPMVVGHEFVGEIVALGSNAVRGLKEGMLVSGEGHIVCGQCRNCLAGRRHNCKHTRGIGVTTSGSFAEYISIPAANVWIHPDGMDRDVAAIFDPFGNATHTALQWNLLGEDVLITGAGPIGCMAAAVCKHAGARHVVVTDLNETRLQVARKLGASFTCNPKDISLQEVQQRLGMLEGFDIGLEMSGVPAALAEMTENMNHGGKISILGLPSEPGTIDWTNVIFKMLNIKGIYGREMYNTWYQMSMMIQNGLDLRPVITHRYEMKDYQKGFDAMLSGRGLKVILKW